MLGDGWKRPLPVKGKTVVVAIVIVGLAQSEKTLQITNYCNHVSNLTYDPVLKYIINVCSYHFCYIESSSDITYYCVTYVMFTVTILKHSILATFHWKYICWAYLHTCSFAWAQCYYLIVMSTTRCTHCQWPVGHQKCKISISIHYSVTTL